MRRLIKDGLIIRKPQAVHSRYRARKFLEARRKVRRKFNWSLKLYTAVNLQITGLQTLISKLDLQRHVIFQSFLILNCWFSYNNLTSFSGPSHRPGKASRYCECPYAWEGAVDETHASAPQSPQKIQVRRNLSWIFQVLAMNHLFLVLFELIKFLKLIWTFFIPFP